MVLDRERWLKTWQLVTSTSPAPDWWDELVYLYDDKTRAYHNSRHIADCLDQFDLVRERFQAPDLVEIAIWVHDIIYDSQRSDNEIQSVAWVRNKLVQSGVASTDLEVIEGLILATQHATVPTGRDAALLVDIDLSILGRPPEQFEMYNEAIRREYAWVSELAYCTGRMAVLQRFLDRPAIYCTDEFQQRFELAARKNLKQAVRMLAQNLERHQAL